MVNNELLDAIGCFCSAHQDCEEAAANGCLMCAQAECRSLRADMTRQGKAFLAALDEREAVVVNVSRQNEVLRKQVKKAVLIIEKMDCDCAADYDREGPDPGPCPKHQALIILDPRPTEGR